MRRLFKKFTALQNNALKYAELRGFYMRYALECVEFSKKLSYFSNCSRVAWVSNPALLFVSSLLSFNPLAIDSLNFATTLFDSIITNHFVRIALKRAGMHWNGIISNKNGNFQQKRYKFQGKTLHNKELKSAKTKYQMHWNFVWNVLQRALKTI